MKECEEAIASRKVCGDCVCYGQGDCVRKDDYAGGKLNEDDIACYAPKFKVGSCEEGGGEDV